MSAGTSAVVHVATAPRGPDRMAEGDEPLEDDMEEPPRAHGEATWDR